MDNNPTASASHQIRAALGSSDQSSPQNQPFITKIIRQPIAWYIFTFLLTFLLLFSCNPTFVQCQKQNEFEKPSPNIKTVFIWSCLITLIVVLGPWITGKIMNRLTI